MMTLAGLQNELHRQVQRALDAGLSPDEIVDSMQAEMDELEVMTGPAVRSDIVEDPKGQ